MKPGLKRALIGLGIVVGVALGGLGAVAGWVAVGWDRPNARPVAALTAPRDAVSLARGAYLYDYAALCWGCHGNAGSLSPEEPQAGGREFDASDVGPGFGVWYASNITPDPETGIGGWTDGELTRAIREGLDREGNVIFPAMAYQFYHGMSDADALALVGYLRSLPPVRNAVAANRPSFPAKALIAFGVLGAEEAITSPIVAPPKGPTKEYGEYLAWHVAGCAECHSPRDPKTVELDRTRLMAGGLFPFPEKGFETTGSNLTPDTATGIGLYTETEFSAAMRTGVRPDGRVLLPFMPWPYYSAWSDDDLHAVWLYLRSLPPIVHEVPRTTLKGAAAEGAGAPRGKALFEVYCRACHGEAGAGARPTKRRLKDRAKELSEGELTVALLSGVRDTLMPPFGTTLTKEQIADLIAYMKTLAP